MKKIQEFEKSSFILFVLMMSTNVCNYLFQIIVGNLMTVEDYGTVNTVLSIVSILTIPTTIITRICARYIALFEATGDEKGIFSVVRILIGLVLKIAIVLFVVVWIGKNLIVETFKIESTGYILGALFISILNLGYSVSAGMLQGLKKFFPYGIQTIWIAAGKLILSIVFVLIGWRVYGVIGAVSIGTVIAIVYGGIHTWKYLKGALQGKEKEDIDIGEFYRYTIGTVIIQGSIIALTNGDILLIKAYFSATEAGVYSSAMVIGKITMYVSTAIVATLFPMVVEKYEKGEDTGSLFKRALLYGGGMSVACGLGLILLGKYVIGILFGSRYEQAIAFLPYVCMYVIPLTFLTILMNYVLAINKSKVFGITVVSSLVIILVLSTMMHDSIPQIMLMSASVLTLVFIINVIYMFVSRKSVKREETGN